MKCTKRRDHVQRCCFADIKVLLFAVLDAVADVVA